MVKLIELQWRDLKNRCYPELDSTTAQCKTMKQMFYAGHASFLNILLSNSLDGINLDIINKLNEEVHEFNKQ